MLLKEQPVPAFSDQNYLFELKYDGYRLLAFVFEGTATLRLRNGGDCTKWFPEVAAGLSELQGSHVLDGEACVLDELGRSDFDRLMRRANAKRWKPGADPVVFCAFDLLFHNGQDIRAKPLKSRKAALKKLLRPSPPSVLYVEHFVGKGEWLYQQAVALQLEGVIAKKADSVYLSGQRSEAWLKIKRPGAVPAERFRRQSAPR